MSTISQAGISPLIRLLMHLSCVNAHWRMEEEEEEEQKGKGLGGVGRWGAFSDFLEDKWTH